MTIEEYNQKKNQLDTEFSNRRMVLLKEYALANNSVKIGDVISDHMKTIKVEKIGVHANSSSSTIPAQCMYAGPELKKNGEPKLHKVKGMIIETIYQSNMKIS